MTVTQVSSASNDANPPAARGERLEQLSQIPYSLLLSADGQIMAMENEQLYWNSIVAHLEAETLRPGAAQTAQMSREMSQEARLNLLSQELVPLVTVASREMSVGEPLTSSIALPSPLGGTIDANIHTTLQSVENGTAQVTNHVSIPREALEEAVQTFAERVVPTGDARSADFQNFMRNVERFSRETRGNLRSLS